MRKTGNNLSMTINNLAVSYNDHGPEDAPAVIFIHGFPFNKSSWDRQVEILKDDFRVIAYDVRGHGNSDPGIGEFFIELFVNDLFRMMDKLNIERATLCGLSMGGYIALSAIVKHPQRVEALLLSDTQCTADTAEGKEKRMMTIENIKKTGVENFADASIKNLFASASFSEKIKEIDEVREMILNTSKQTLFSTLVALADRKETCSRLHEINCPVLIMVGKEDKITPLAAAKFMHEKIQDSTLRMIAHAGHVANIENPDSFNYQLTKFMDLVGKKRFCLSDTDGN
ncbi:MAG TPA: alpha/beta fold hydrolase [Chitinophagaceae bacterium]|nr:alpha/beta fold hydrolase [Chitinophagaceae bacterium]